MGRWPRCAVLAALGVASAIGLTQERAGAAPDIADTMLDDLGDGWRLVDESPDASGTFTRTFDGNLGVVVLAGFAVDTPPGTRTLFAATPTFAGLEFIDAPSLDLARWIVPTGGRPGDGGVAALTFASRDHIFTASLTARDTTTDAARIVLEVATRQVAAAGPPSPAADSGADESPDERSVDDDELLVYLPDQPPNAESLDAGSVTLSGPDDFAEAGFADNEVVDFLDRRTKNVAKVWAGTDLRLAIGVTQFPYDIFAAAALAAADDDRDVITGSPTSGGSIDDAVLYRTVDRSQIGLVFRRGDILVTVLTEYHTPELAATAATLALDAAELVAARLPPGDTSPYTLPTPLNRLAGLTLTTGVVIAAVAGSRTIAWLRARRVRRRWSRGADADVPPANEPAFAPPLGAATVIPLDADATRLRRRGAVVMAVQLATIVIGVVALSGDFAWPGVIVAATSLVIGLAFTRLWWQHERDLLGPRGPRRAFRLPRLSGALIGVGAFAVLGVGTAYFLKGVRYVIFDPTLAQLRWSDLLGLAPRTVGVVFALGGLITAAIGAVLWRVARAFARASLAVVLREDQRPPVLYLRSFGDDALPLPVIASARRPLFEFFSLRGADPFEECVAWELDSYGPVIAVGRPGGSLVSLGAAREHLPQEMWHDEIEERMGDAGCIVLAPGETAGLAWELQAIVRGQHLGKTVFVFPPVAPDQLQRRWDHTVAVLVAAGAWVGSLPAAPRTVHTLQIVDTDAMRATCASTRDEATYRTAVDRALEARSSQPPAGAVAAV